MPNAQLYLDKLEDKKTEKMFKLVPRDYQKSIVEKTLGSLLLTNNKEIVIESPTSSGKSLIISMLAKELVPQYKVAILVNITPLIDQIAEHLDMMGIEYSILKAGYENKWNQQANVQLIMSQTLFARKDKMDVKADIVIQDEVHKEWNTKRTKEVLSHLGSICRIGLSATPYDNKGYALQGMDDLIQEVTIKELEEKGFLVPVKYFVPKFVTKIDYSNLKIQNTGDYSEQDIDNIVLRKDFMEPAIEAMIKQGIKNKKTIVFCNSIEHSEEVARRLREKGVEAYPYHSNQDKNEAEEIITKFKEPNAKITLCSINKISIGFDVKDIELGVMLRRTMVRSLYIQQIGRLIRKAPNKKYAELLDIAGNLGLHGFHYEIYKPPQYGNKNELIKIQNKHKIDILNHIVEDGKEITKEIVLETIKEIERKNNDLKSLKLEELLSLYDLVWEPRQIVKVGLEISNRIHSETYDDNTIDWILEGWNDLIEEFPEYENMIIKAMKTMIKNKIKKGSKVKGMHYSAQWFRENNDFLKNKINMEVTNEYF